MTADDGVPATRSTSRRRAPISILVLSVDSPGQSHDFNTLAEAQAFAQNFLGPNPERMDDYAVADDCPTMIVVDGAHIDDLFPQNEED